MFGWGTGRYYTPYNQMYKYYCRSEVEQHAGVCTIRLLTGSKAMMTQWQVAASRPLAIPATWGWHVIGHRSWLALVVFQ